MEDGDGGRAEFPNGFKVGSRQDAVLIVLDC